MQLLRNYYAYPKGKTIFSGTMGLRWNIQIGNLLIIKITLAFVSLRQTIINGSRVTAKLFTSILVTV